MRCMLRGGRPHPSGVFPRDTGGVMASRLLRPWRYAATLSSRMLGAAWRLCRELRNRDCRQGTRCRRVDVSPRLLCLATAAPGAISAASCRREAPDECVVSSEHRRMSCSSMRSVCLRHRMLHVCAIASGIRRRMHTSRHGAVAHLCCSACSRLRVEECRICTEARLRAWRGIQSAPRAAHCA